jgi:hypothetical protein
MLKTLRLTLFTSAGHMDGQTAAVLVGAELELTTGFTGIKQ